MAGNAEEWPLVGLHDETLLPGEQRTFTGPTLDAAALAAMAGLVGKGVVAVTITSPIELPGLASGRFGTFATIASVDGGAVTLRGERRVRITSARGSGSPFVALVSPVQPEADADREARVGALVDALGAAVAALGGGARPLRPLDGAVLEAAAVDVLRAIGGPEDLRRAQQTSVVDALRAFGRQLAADAPLVAGGRVIETAVAASPGAVADPELMRRLWSQCVELMRRLDVYDPSTGSEENDVARLQRRLMQAGLPKEAKDTAKRELRLLRQMETRHHDYPTYLQHLDWMARLAWHPDLLPPPDLDKVERALDAEHSGLGKVKTRILEYLAVRQLGGRAASTVLCIAGPPGVGKTTIAMAVAGALGRRFARVALGGVHDESELRGHRISYTAAQPGRIVQAMAHAGQSNALLLLDEIDKLGTDSARSPTGALLEILDPSQHAQFRDHYLGVPYDLSNVLFVCTANDIGRIHPILRDRLEIVELEGYSEREKIQIARGHLLPRIAAEHGLASPVPLSDEVLALIVAGYTREAGVRELQRVLAAIHRDRALAVVRKDPRPEVFGEEELTRLLGRARASRRRAEPFLAAGVANGLSVSADGGQLLPIEVLVGPGGPDLRLTGRIGEVMRESAQAVVSYLRHHRASYGVDDLGSAVHFHAPEGAVPKDGPSAGVALFAALLSAATGRRVRGDVAMTGEVTLHGRVLPVGGVKAKVLAAERAGIRTVLVPQENQADVPGDVSCAIVYLHSLDEVPSVALEETP